MASTINASNTGAGGVITTADASGVLVIQAAGTNTITANSTSITMSNTVLNNSGRPILNQSGSVLQIVQSIANTNLSTSSTTFQASGLIANITLSSTSSRVLVIIAGGNGDPSASNLGGDNKLYRSIGGGAYSNVTSQATDWGVYQQGATQIVVPHAFAYLDSPANTSTISYQPYFRVNPNGSGGTYYFNVSYFVANAAGTISLTLMEIAG